MLSAQSFRFHIAFCLVLICSCLTGFQVLWWLQLSYMFSNKPQNPAHQCSINRFLLNIYFTWQMLFSTCCYSVSCSVLMWLWSHGSQKCQGVGTWGPSSYLRVWSMGDRAQSLSKGDSKEWPRLTPSNKGHIFSQGQFQVLIKHIFVIELYWAQSLVICYLNDFAFLYHASVSPNGHRPHVSLTELSFLCRFEQVIPLLKTFPWHTDVTNPQTSSLKVLYQLWTFSLLPHLLLTVLVPWLSKNQALPPSWSPYPENTALTWR